MKSSVALRSIDVLTDAIEAAQGDIGAGDSLHVRIAAFCTPTLSFTCFKRQRLVNRSPEEPELLAQLVRAVEVAERSTATAAKALASCVNVSRVAQFPFVCLVCCHTRIMITGQKAGGVGRTGTSMTDVRCTTADMIVFTQSSTVAAAATKAPAWRAETIAMRTAVRSMPQERIASLCRRACHARWVQESSAADALGHVTAELARFESSEAAVCAQCGVEAPFVYPVPYV